LFTGNETKQCLETKPEEDRKLRCRIGNSKITEICFSRKDEERRGKRDQKKKQKN
jgi:hypothetical protein